MKVTPKQLEKAVEAGQKASDCRRLSVRASVTAAIATLPEPQDGANWPSDSAAEIAKLMREKNG
jgi:hypothetical protein